MNTSKDNKAIVHVVSRPYILHTDSYERLTYLHKQADNGWREYLRFMGLVAVFAVSLTAATRLLFPPRPPAPPAPVILPPPQVNSRCVAFCGVDNHE
jgi:hypothetical protein